MTLPTSLRPALLAFALACHKPAPSVEAAPQSSPNASAPQAASSGPQLFGSALSYPPGPWRHASPQDLERLVLWPSHLLVRYDGVIDAENVAFKMADFHSVLPPSTRSRDEALALARELALRAREAPERFAELVRAHSEDIVTRDRGGSLGGIPAAQLSPWPQVLDALTALPPGGVSEIVETWYGFHVFQRRAAPAPDTLTGRRLVIGHDQARFLSRLRGGSQPARSRDEALALAQRLYEQARAAPAGFPQLIQVYSELPDRVVGGDLGTWGNRELTPFPREIEVLDQLAVGEVAPPIDSLFGIEVLQRVPNPERTSYAFDGVQLSFDSTAPDGDPTSRASVQAEAHRLNELLLRDPAQLEALTQRYAAYRNQWLDGRGLAGLTVAVRDVALGEMLRLPADIGVGFLVGRRSAPRAEESLAALIELPVPSSG